LASGVRLVFLEAWRKRQRRSSRREDGCEHDRKTSTLARLAGALLAAQLIRQEGRAPRPEFRLTRCQHPGAPGRDPAQKLLSNRRSEAVLGRRGHSGRPGTQPALPGGGSARPSICARSSSRKRAQSARRSSETNSPGGSGSGPCALSGCCLGSRNHSPLPVETVGNSCVRTAGAARLGLKRRRRGSTLRRRGRPANPPNVRADQTLRGAELVPQLVEALQDPAARSPDLPPYLARRIASKVRVPICLAIAVARGESVDAAEGGRAALDAFDARSASQVTLLEKTK
jgi:hypothetical protein